MKKIFYHIILCVLLFSTAQGWAADHSVINPKCEMLHNPIGLDVTAPRFSWQARASQKGMKQISYQLIVSSSKALLEKGKGDLWNSGKVLSGQSVHIVYSGKPLQSRKTYFWKVKVWSDKNEEDWSEPSSFTMGLMNASDWKGKWIGLDRAFPWDSVTKFSRLSARYNRKEFETTKQVRSATVFIAGLGLYELYINGNKIGDQVLAPAPTDYSKTVLYNTFDVTEKIKNGRNTIGTILGNGRFFAMRQNYKPQKWHTFGFPKMLLQLEIVYTDDSRQMIVSDGSWKSTADGPIRTNNEYDGEEYDATRELHGWNVNGYNDSKWIRAEIVKTPGGKLTAQMNGNMRVMKTLEPVSINQLPSGIYILDMGQNMAGWIRMRVQGKRGEQVKLRFAESLQADGNLYTANLRDAIVTDIYTLKGDGEESWLPRFVYHGFRYVEITGYPGKPAIDHFKGEVIYDDLQNAGSLQTSNAIINRVHKNAWWGISSNYKGMPVDCPQRNERQPWLGDRTTGAYGESFLFDNSMLYAKWLNDIRDAQTPEGRIPDVAPSFWFYYKDNMTWPGAYLTIADMLHRQYADVRSIQKHYPSMKKWMMYMKSKYLKENIMTKDSYGDWCVPPESPELIHSRDSTRKTDPKLIATAYYYYLLKLMQRFAVLSNNKQDISFFDAEAARVRSAFNKNFYNSTEARYSNNTVTANLLPLAFNIVPAADSARLFNNIVNKIVDGNNSHISTGVIGTQWLMRWLTKYGRPDIAYRLASNTTYPSWGYMAENGATTIWELWNGNTADPAMNSQNHVMLLGDLLIWMYENLAGIQSDVAAVGFKKIIMKPSFITGLDSVNASYVSPYGTITSSWKTEGEKISWNISIPANTSAVIYIPATSAADVNEQGKTVMNNKDVKFLRMENALAVFEIGSGDYSFAAKRSLRNF